MPSADWLRSRFSARSAQSAIVDVEPGAPEESFLIPAAVLVPIVLRVSGPTVLLTERTPHLRDHGGQVSFPGGRSEPGDASPVETALREAEEEVGIERSRVEVLGTLPDYCTGTGFRVVPVVGLVFPPLNLRLDDFEVAGVFEPPLEFLLDPAHHLRQRIEHEGMEREYWAVPWQGRYIWGATAGMIVSLHRFLHAP